MHGAINQPHRLQEPRPSWWVAPVCFLIVGGFWTALGVSLANRWPL